MESEPKKYAIGVDLGGTSVKYAVVSSAGEIIFDGQVPSNASVSAQAVTAQIILAVETCLNEARHAGLRIEGVGIGTPGIIDAAGRVVLGGAENIAGWKDVPLSDLVEKACGLRTSVNNDANLMALGETRYGAARGCTDVVFLTVGTGIGGGVMIDGRLYGGYRNRGMELGHVPLIADGVPCQCGSAGCLEAYASTSALVRRFSERSAEAGIVWERKVDGEFIVGLFKRNHPVAAECMEEHCRLLGHGIAGIINTFSPQRVVIGGGISESGSFYIDKISGYALRYALEESARDLRIVAAELGNRAGCFGAAALIL